MIIAIDGPSGAGKSSLADSLGKELNFVHIDTGAMYRAVGLYASRHGVDSNDANAVAALLNDITLTIAFEDGRQLIYCNGEDVSADIRKPEVSMLASNVSKIPAVRSFLVEQQRRIAGEMNIIMDGRDIGTVVFPNADLKIFLTASPECRASRRFLEQQEKGFDVRYDDVLADVIRRDRQDTTRDIAPLKPAADSIVVDTSGYEYAVSLALLRKVVKEKLGI